MTSAQEAARQIANDHVPVPSKRDRKPICDYCLRPYPCPSAIVAREVLAQAERTCGTCFWRDADDPHEWPVCVHPELPSVRFVNFHGEIKGCLDYEPR